MNGRAALARACTDHQGHRGQSRNGRCAHEDVLKAGHVGAAPWLRVLQVLLAVLALAAGVARAETFDLVTFDTPAGVRSRAAEALGFSDATPTTFVTYAVYKSAASSGDPARDFQDEWKLLLGQYQLTSELKSGTTDWPGRWKLTTGAARVWSDQQRNFVALLNVFTGHGVKVSVLVNYNDDLYRPRIDKFLASIRVAAPAVVAAPAAPTPAPLSDSGAPLSLTSNEWYRSVGSTWAKDGYLRYRYRFLADGTYSFMKEWWSQYHHTDYWFIEESGRYRLDGNTIQLAPGKATKILRDKAGSQKAAAEPVPLEAATYRYAFRDLQKSNLVLTPNSGQRTARDGQFSFAGDGVSYYYEPPSRCEQRPTPADCP